MISRFTATRPCDIISKPEVGSFLRQGFSLHLTAKEENETVHSTPFFFFFAKMALICHASSLEAMI